MGKVKNVVRHYEQSLINMFISISKKKEMSHGESLHPLLQKKFRLGELLSEYIIKGVSFISFAVIILIFVFVFREALPVFSPAEKKIVNAEDLQIETYGDDTGTESQVLHTDKQSESGVENRDLNDNANLKNLSGTTWQPVSDEPKYGLLPLFWGSFKVTILAILFGGPIAILAALYTAVLAPKRLKEFIKPVIELLAGFPSVVIGFFALVTVASVMQNLLGYQYRLNSFVGGIALSLAVIPIIYTVADDAMTTVPKHLMEASLALGATKWQTALFVILPAAAPGVFAAMLLGIGRAFGETMIVLMATGNASLMSLSIFQPVRTMSATIGAEMAEVVFGDVHYNVLFLIGSILFVFTFILNAVAEFYVKNRLLKKFKGT